MTSPWRRHLRISVREVSLVDLTPEGRVQDVTQPVSIFLSLEVIPRLRHSHRDLCLTPEILMDVERVDILGNIVQNRVTDPQ